MFGQRGSKQRVEKQLTSVNQRLRRAREELLVLDEQLSVLREHADEDDLRAVVAEVPDRESRDARRSADAMARSRQDLVQTIADLERAQDDLLARLP